MNIFKNSQHIAFASICTKPTLAITEANNKFFNLFKSDEDKISNNTLSELDEKSSIIHFLKEHLPDIQHLEKELIEHIWIKGDWYEVILYPFSQEDVHLVFRKESFLESMQDTTADMKKNELENQTLPGAIYRCKFDQEWTMLYATRNIFHICGYTSDELTKKTFQGLDQLIVDEDREFVAEEVQKAIDGKSAWEIEYRIIHKSGELRWIFERGQTVSDKNGNTLFLEGFLLDVTERKKSELSIIEEKRQFEDLINAQPSGVYRIVYKKFKELQGKDWFTINKSLDIEILNRRMTELTGYDLATLKQDIYLITQLIHPDEQEDFAKKNQYCVQNLTPFFWEGRMRQSGEREYFWIQFRATPRLRDNGDLVYTGILTDVSEQKHAELREEHFKNLLKYIVENMDSTVALIDKDNRFVYTSQKYLRDFGILDKKVIGEYSYDIFPNLPENIIQAHAQALQGISSRSEKDKIVLPDQIQYNKWSCIPWFEADGTVGGYVVYIEDITSKVQMEQELEDRQEKLVEAQRIAKLGSWEFDLQTQEVFWSDQIYHLLGIDKKNNSITYDDFLEVVHPEDRVKVDQAFNDALYHKKPYEIIHRLLDKNGQIKVVQEKSEITYDEFDKPIKATGTMQDITETVKTEEELKKSNQYLNNLFTYANAPIIVWDKDNKITKFNKAFENYTGRIERDVIGKGLEILFPPDAIESCMSLIQHTSDGERLETVEIPIQHISGKVFTFIWNSAPIVDFEEKQTVGTIAQGQDITERKRIEEEIKRLNLNLEQLVEERTKQLNDSLEILNNTSSRVPGMIFQLKRTKEGKLSFPYVSPGIKELWGLDPESVAFDASSILDKIHPDDIEMVSNLLRSSLLDPKALSYEYRVLEENGKIKWVFTNALTYVDEEESVHWYGHTYDITSRKKAEKEILQAKEEAEIANQSKSKFLSRMSHELRTPLNSILGFAQLMDLGELSASHKKSLDFILSNGRHLLQLINEVLDITTIESGNYKMSLEAVAVKPIIQEVIDLAKPTFQKRGISVQISADFPNDLVGLLDKLRFKQIVLNVLDNAIKYNYENGKVWINGGVDPSNSQRLMIVVMDTGLGIAKEDLSKLFDPFQRLGAESSLVEGSGLGLTIVKQLVEVMHGEVEVVSELGKGTIFTMYFPIVEWSESLISQASTVREDSVILTKSESQKVVYIEDNLSNIELVKDIFELSLPNVKLIHSKFGQEAVALAMQHQPQIILLDLDLPDINGAEVLKQLLANPQTSTIPVIIVSSNAMPEQVKNLLDSGAKDYLVKPLQIKDFVKKISVYIE
ncbi:PAS domain-containing protein [Mongoliitalea daihaiensis]|uniref:PAS domain-containing protein n=1 Tax=Mongoliitalea daihaiensis TaxID=2782006 RepID=UPI001F2FEB94|nr:PAS domain-containing protein [Mongoliitalea daihaiensis]UJP63707.1 PAS domain-containing protein [Mongoliitalea daihaiensis]